MSQVRLIGHPPTCLVFSAMAALERTFLVRIELCRAQLNRFAKRELAPVYLRHDAVVPGEIPRILEEMVPKAMNFPMAKEYALAYRAWYERDAGIFHGSSVEWCLDTLDHLFEEGDYHQKGSDFVKEVDKRLAEAAAVEKEKEMVRRQNREERCRLERVLSYLDEHRPLGTWLANLIEEGTLMQAAYCSERGAPLLTWGNDQGQRRATEMVDDIVARWMSNPRDNGRWLHRQIVDGTAMDQFLCRSDAH